MNLSRSLKQICKEMKVSIAELARRTGQSQQNLGKKLRNETLSFEEFIYALDMIGVRFEYSFIMPGGEQEGAANDLKKANEMISVLEANAELEKRKVEFIMNQSRYIRTYLYTMAGSIDKAMKSLNDPKQTKENLSKIKIGQEQISAVLDRSFSVSRIGVVTPLEFEEMPNITADKAIIAGKRVLLVDDNALNREVAADVLMENGLRVEEADDGASAVKMVADNEPGYYDFILMDIQMPKVDGYEATRRIRALPNRVRAGVPIIAITASAFDEDKQKAYDTGMDDFLTKPVNPANMLHILAKYV